MDVLALIHGDEVRSGVFADAAEARGDRIDEWSIAWGTPPPKPVDSYDAVLVFGGAMHPDQDHIHPWLRDESLLIERLLDTHVPVLGVCLGAQLIARAAGAPVLAAREPEVGWYRVELTEAGRGDPLFAHAPESFTAFQWHFYTHGLPAGAVELAGSAVCTQAFRLGDSAWGVQCHPEVTIEQIEQWAVEAPEDVEGSVAELVAESRERIAEWNTFGRDLCGAFLALAAGERLAA
jgi:GMP synthase-like glutamine amidotransferase